MPLSSRAFSHARGHLRVSRVFLDGLRKKKEAARSLCEFSPFSFFGRQIVLFEREHDFDKVYRVNSLHVVS